MSLQMHLKRLDSLTRLLDSQFRLGPLRFGLDPIVGFFPVIGDIIPNVITVYTLIIAIKEQIPAGSIFLIIINALLDTTLGSIPVLGDIFDTFYKSHRRNYQLLVGHLNQE